MFSSLDVGVVHVEDFVELALTDGLKESTPRGILARLGRLVGGPDEDHRVASVVGAAHRTLHGLLATATMRQVIRLYVSMN